jgi:hypothetical protein
LLPFQRAFFTLQFDSARARYILQEWYGLKFWFHGLISPLALCFRAEELGTNQLWTSSHPYLQATYSSNNQHSTFRLIYQNICRCTQHLGRNRSWRWGVWLRCTVGSQWLLVLFHHRWP